MNCQYEERSKSTGSCIFAYNCNEDCLYRYKYESTYVDELEQEIKECKEELWDSYHNEEEFKELEEELRESETYKNNLLELCKILIQNTKLNEEELKEEINSACLEYDDMKELDRELVCK